MFTGRSDTTSIPAIEELEENEDEVKREDGNSDEGGDNLWDIDGDKDEGVVERGVKQGNFRPGKHYKIIFSPNST